MLAPINNRQINNKYENNNSRKNNDMTFRNSAVITSALNFLNNEEIFGAVAVDIGSMVIPRTVVDASRSPELTLETLRRESSSSVLLGGVGFFGMAAAYLLSPFMKNKYNVPLYKIEANNKTMDAFASAFSHAVKKSGTQDKTALAKTYIKTVFDGVSGDDSLKPVKDEIVDTLTKYLTESKDYSLSSVSKKHLFDRLVSYTGETDNIKMLAKNGQSIEISAKDLIKDTYSMGRAFMQDKVLPEFKNADKIADNKFLKQLKNMTGKQTLIGLAAASAVGMSMQYINSWLTKKKTGTDGFSAVKGHKAEKDTSFGFKAMKATAAVGMGALVMSTIGNIKQLPAKLQFNGLVANVPQLKVVYGMTIIGRFLAARDKNELRESVFRDTMGFMNWLIFGGMVTNFVASKLDKSLVKSSSVAGKSGVGKLLSMKLKNHNDLIYGSDYIKNSLKAGVDVSSLKMKDILRRVDEPTRKLVKKLNIAQMSGYLYSGIALGVLLPVINKKITHHLLSKASEKTKDETVENSDYDSKRAQILKLK